MGNPGAIVFQVAPSSAETMIPLFPRVAIAPPGNSIGLTLLAPGAAMLLQAAPSLVPFKSRFPLSLPQNNVPLVVRKKNPPGVGVS